VRAQGVLGQVLASIDNTLAVASLLARPDPINPEDTDIDTLVAVTVGDMSSAERGRVVIQRSTGTRTASMDMSLVRLALRNLLSNALKYSAPDAPVVIRLADSDEPLALLLDVIDRGPGIAGEALQTLFQRGATRGLASPGSPHGMGLGLYIVRRVMELHGGRALLAANGPGGATFRLEIAQPVGD
jgi:two-component system, OmpR family, sensor kinase